MTNEELSSIKIELEHGLYHIEEALRLAEVTKDIFCVYTITVAKNLVLGFLRTTSKLLNDRKFTNLKTVNAGWNPMKSQFPGILRFNKSSSGRGHGEQGSNLDDTCHQHCIKNKRPVKTVKLQCSVCYVNCNSESQLEHHLKGNHHMAALACEEPHQKMKMIYLTRSDIGFYRTTVREQDKFCPMKRDNGRRKHQGRLQNVKEAKIQKRISFGKQLQVSTMRCELCDVTCNGDLQYRSHINGKRHKMAEEHRD